MGVVIFRTPIYQLERTILFDVSFDQPLNYPDTSAVKLTLILPILKWRVAPSFRDLAERVSPRRLVQLIIFAPLILLTIAALGIPSDIWDQSLSRAYGLSVQAWGPWLRDWILNQVLMLIVGDIAGRGSLWRHPTKSAALVGSTSGWLPFLSCWRCCFSNR